MRLRAGDAKWAVRSAPGYEFVVEIDGRIHEDLEVVVDESMHLVIVKVLGERVND